MSPMQTISLQYEMKIPKYQNFVNEIIMTFVVKICFSGNTYEEGTKSFIIIDEAVIRKTYVGRGLCGFDWGNSDGNRTDA